MSDYEPLDPLSLDRARKVHDDQVKRNRIQRSQDVRQLMNSVWGRRLMHGLLEDARTYQASFNTNAMQMSFAEGRRSFGLDLLAYVQLTCPDQFVVMLQESMKRQTRKDSDE